MGLSGRKEKQRIPADPRNLSWADNAAKFGQTYLQKFGWETSKGLGVQSDGRTTHIKVSQKLDLMGIGAQHQKDPNGIAWKQNSDFEKLLKRLNGSEGGVETLEEEGVTKDDDEEGEREASGEGEDEESTKAGEKRKQKKRDVGDDKHKRKRRKADLGDARESIQMNEEETQAEAGVDLYNHKDSQSSVKKRKKRDRDETEPREKKNKKKRNADEDDALEKDRGKDEEKRDVDENEVKKKKKKKRRNSEEGDALEKNKGKHKVKEVERVTELATVVATTAEKKKVASVRPLAHRARLIASKRMAYKDSAAVLEILGLPRTSLPSTDPAAPQNSSTTQVSAEGLHPLTTSSKSVMDYFKEKMLAKSSGSSSVTRADNEMFSASSPGLGISMTMTPGNFLTDLDSDTPKLGLGAKSNFSSFFPSMNPSVLPSLHQPPLEERRDEVSDETTVAVNGGCNEISEEKDEKATRRKTKKEKKKKSRDS